MIDSLVKLLYYFLKLINFGEIYLNISFPLHSFPLSPMMERSKYVTLI